MNYLFKGRKSVGNRVTKQLIQKVMLKEVGGSTLAARKIWFDQTVGRLNDDERGVFLGDFKGEDKILSIYENGEYRLSNFDLSTRFDEGIVHLEKWNTNHAISAVYYDGGKGLHYVKRFLCEVTSDKRVSFISESKGSVLNTFSTAYQPEVKIVFNKLLKQTKNLPDKIVRLHDFIEIKGLKAQGNQLTKFKVKEVVLTHDVQKGSLPWPDLLEENNAEVLKVTQTIENKEDSRAKNKQNVNNKAEKTNAKNKVETEKINSKKDQKSRAKPLEDSSNTVEWDLTDKNSKDDEQMKLF